MAENLVLVKLRDYAKTMFYECGQLGCRPNDMVIVEAERGLDYGMVVVAESPPPAERQQEGPVRNVARLATGADREIIARNRQDCRGVVDARQNLAANESLWLEIQQYNAHQSTRDQDRGHPLAHVL